MFGGSLHNYTKITKLGENPFDIMDFVSTEKWQEAKIIDFLDKIKKEDWPSLTYRKGSFHTNTYINGKWILRIRLNNIPLSNTYFIGHIAYHKCVSVWLVSEAKDEFLLFTIGGEGYGESRPYNYAISMPDMLTLDCLSAKESSQLPKHCKNVRWANTKSKDTDFLLSDKNAKQVLGKIKLFLELFSVAARVESIFKMIDTKEVGVISMGESSNCFIWITTYHYGIRLLKELKYKKSSKKIKYCTNVFSKNQDTLQPQTAHRTDCSKQVYHDWHFAKLMYSIFSDNRYEYEEDWSIEKHLKNLLKWETNSIQKRTEMCCLLYFLIENASNYLKQKLSQGSSQDGGKKASLYSEMYSFQPLWVKYKKYKQKYKQIKYLR